MSEEVKNFIDKMAQNDMVGADAIKLRRKFPTLQKAWNRYKTIWHLVNDQ